MLLRYSERLDAAELIKHLESGLGDHTDIKLMCHFMLVQLVKQSPHAVLQHLEALVSPLQKTLDARIKTDAVKQEVWQPV